MDGEAPSRKKQVGVFVAFTVLNVLLICLGGLYYMFVEGPGGGAPVFTATLWVFAFPYSVAHWLRLEPLLVLPLMLLNPFIYGGIWWLTWRMFVLMRRKPE